MSDICVDVEDQSQETLHFFQILNTPEDWLGWIGIESVVC